MNEWIYYTLIRTNTHLEHVDTSKFLIINVLLLLFSGKSYSRADSASG